MRLPMMISAESAREPTEPSVNYCTSTWMSLNRVILTETEAADRRPFPPWRQVQGVCLM